MKKFILAALLSATVLPAFAGVKVIGTLPNGDKIVRIKSAGVFAPSTTTILAVGKAPGEIAVLNQTGGPGFVPAVANAGGLVGAAAVLRPARSSTNVSQEGGGASSASNSTSGATAAGGNATGGNSNATGGNSNATGGTGGSASGNSFVPPGHQGTNPGNGH
jgi:hypothetical protein